MINTGTAKSSTVHDLISTITYLYFNTVINTALFYDQNCTVLYTSTQLLKTMQGYTHCTGYPSADIRYPATPDIWFVVKRDIRPAEYPEKSLHLIPKKLPNPLIKNGQIQ